MTDTDRTYRRVPTLADRMQPSHTETLLGRHTDDGDSTTVQLRRELADARDSIEYWQGINGILARERDDALALAEMRQAVADRNAAEARAAGQVIDAVRTGTLEDIERALAAYDAPGDLAGRRDQPRDEATGHPGDALAYALRDAFDTADLDLLHGEMVETYARLDGEPGRETVGRLTDALFAARWWRRDAAPVPAPARAGEPTWDDCTAVANALAAAPGTGEIWRDHLGDITGAPLSLARVAVKALIAAGRLGDPAPGREG